MSWKEHQAQFSSSNMSMSSLFYTLFNYLIKVWFSYCYLNAGVQLSFRTRMEEGLILCALSPGEQEEFVALQMRNGRPYFLFDPQVGYCSLCWHACIYSGRDECSKTIQTLYNTATPHCPQSSSISSHQSDQISSEICYKFVLFCTN